MYKKLVLFVLVSLMMSAMAVAQCATPSASGTLRICYPSNGSSIIGGTTFELSANTGGASIDKISVYDNGVKVDSLGFLPSTLVEGAIHDGYHKVTINAWDTNGHLYSASTAFTKVGGFDPGICAASVTGVNMCSPKSGALEPNVSVPVSFTVKTVNPTKAWKFYFDGSLVRTSDYTTLKRLTTALGTSAGRHTATVVAWDSAGQVYKTSQSFTTFYQRSCNPDTDACTPGILVDAPGSFGPYRAVEAPKTFDFHAEVTGNAAPIQKMSITLDGVVIAQGQGPGIVKTISTSEGSHSIVVQALDTAGKLYATYGTVDVQ